MYGGKIRASGSGDELLEDSDHTVIQTQRLLPETISKIEKVLQDSQGLGIESAHAPRQKLEDLFMKIVEQAKAEQLSNSGALHGGKTAAFLAEDATDGAGLVESLAATPVAKPVKVVKPIQSKEKASAANVLNELVKEAPIPAEKTRNMIAPHVASDVDRGVLDGLLGNDPKSPGSKSS